MLNRVFERFQYCVVRRAKSAVVSVRRVPSPPCFYRCAMSTENIGKEGNAPPVKRGRGRPRKAVNDDHHPVAKKPRIELPTSKVTEQQGMEPPIKKGRGRPRKTVTENHQPVAKKPPAELPSNEVHVSEQQVVEEQVAKEQVAEEQVTKEQVAEEQVGKEQVTKEQVTEEQATEEQVAKEQVAEEQVAEPPPKKGRGRPRKVVAADSQPAAKKSRVEEQTNEDMEQQVAEPPVKKGRGRPKKTATAAAGGKHPKESTDGVEAGPSVSNAKASAKPSNTTDFSKVDLSTSAKTSDGRLWNLKFSSWNVNGVRAWLKNDALQYIREEKPNIFCLQETKCSENDLPKAELEVEGYYSYWSSADQKGYSGTGVYTKQKPLSVSYGMGINSHDSEGRLITLEFEEYFFVTAYVPNAGEKLKRLDYRSNEWDGDFRAYLKSLDSKKPVILCGDLNVAHEEIDLANPKGNTKTAGFTKEERKGFSTLLSEGFTDTFRSLYPDRKEAYSYWSYRTNARPRNKGWRLDYFVVSNRFMKNVCDSLIRSEVYGSDHCPIVLLVAL